MDNLDKQIDDFLSAKAFAVVGASDETYKFGHKVYRNYLSHGKTAYPVNPKVETVMGNKAFPDLLTLPEKDVSVSIVTPPPVTEKVVDDAITAGIKNIWMQPGAESAEAIRKAEAAGINVIHGGPCVLVVMGYAD